MQCVKLEKTKKSDVKLRNISLLIIIIAIVLLVIWMISYLNSDKNTLPLPLLLAFGVALLIGGIFLLTRIQYIIWLKERF